MDFFKMILSMDKESLNGVMDVATKAPLKTVNLMEKEKLFFLKATP